MVDLSARARDRARMVAGQLSARGIRDARVLRAMGAVPRELFVPPEGAADAYRDGPLPIGLGQTISQPYVVAFMTEVLELEGQERVLEVGTGSGYQAAILGELAEEVWTLEIHEPLAERARELLAELRYSNVHAELGDGGLGLPRQAPFDAILVAAAPLRIPRALRDQLAPKGRMVLPVGGSDQELVRVRREGDRYVQERLLPVRFVPLTGAAAGRSGA